MKYIVFADDRCYYNSIIRVCDKDLPTIKAHGLMSGYGMLGIHEASGGYVFEGIEMLRHFFQGARDVFGQCNSTFGSPTYEEKESRMNMTAFMYSFCIAKKIKEQEKMVGGMNADQHHEDPENPCYTEFLDYLQTEEPEEYKRQIEFVEEGRIRQEEDEKYWKDFYKKKREDKLKKAEENK
jgi:hypothetical protein